MIPVRAPPVGNQGRSQGNTVEAGRAASAIRKDFAAALRLYRTEPLPTQLFVRARRMLTPVTGIVSHIPETGSVLDVGCGHGLFTFALALAYPQRRFVGIDPSLAKLAVAERVGRRVPNTAFRNCPVEAMAGEKFGVILILDVLYLVPPEQKRAILRACRALMAPGGVLILKANDTTPVWKYEVARAQEKLMTGAGLTMGTGALHFFSRAQNAELLQETGFQPTSYPLRHWTPYPHVLFVART